MMLSLNEIETTLRKAALGAGLGFGAAEEVGRAGAWLCARGWDGVAAALAGLDRPGAPCEAVAEGVCRFRKAAAASAGLAAIDLLLGDCGVREARLEGLDSPWLLVGLAGIAVEAGNAAFRLRLGDAEALVRPAGLDIAGAVPARGCDAALWVDEAPQHPASAPRASAGAEVRDEDWRRALALAQRTYVPASDRSRRFGAGAGARDED
ncbi:MAG: DUF3726 domain-containing protein [Paracoccaceae bacterium]|nr:DUF3726 domain-containing protein [Paracoccaceae bacterium]